MSQKVQQEMRLQEHLRKIQKETEERKKVFRQAAVATSSKSSVFPTDHGVTNKGAMKNVSFAPNAYVYSIQNSKGCVQSDEIMSSENHKSESDIIVEAPYTLAVKGTELNNGVSSDQNGVTVKPERPPSPPVPAIRTKNILKSLPKTEDIVSIGIFYVNNVILCMFKYCLISDPFYRIYV